MKKESIIAVLVSTINTARDCCVDAGEAVRDTFSDLGLPYDDGMVMDAIIAADAEWAERRCS